LKIEPFAEYGFNKSHAAAYAIIAYQTAYLKTYYPNEFFAASMSMELSNQKKLSEFYEELKRLNINIIRPDINKCFSDFSSNEQNFYYALGAIKNVGYEAISNIVKEREENGPFTSINNFINRVNPKDINKLQLEGLVKAGAFDNLNNNRQSLYNSIPSLILKSKNIFENKLNNQTALFLDNDEQNEDILISVDDWSNQVRLSKEFETLGFFISDHPLNQFKEIFKDYNIIDYSQFNSKNELQEASIASTLLKVQEKKTQKGSSYAIIKLSDLSGVFELFLFSDIFELNRTVLKEGNSFLITLTKSISTDDNKFRRINVKKIVSLNEAINKPINEVTFVLDDLQKLDLLKKIQLKKGNSEVNINLKLENKNMIFKLKEKRQIDRNLLNTLKNMNISSSIK